MGTAYEELRFGVNQVIADLRANSDDAHADELAECIADADRSMTAADAAAIKRTEDANYPPSQLDRIDWAHTQKVADEGHALCHEILDSYAMRYGKAV